MANFKKNLLNNLKNTYCRLRKSKKNNIGVFAIRNIPKNVNPFLNYGKEKWFKVEEKEIAVLPKEVIKMLKQFYTNDNGYYQIPYHGLNGNDISFYVNHSYRPNMITKDDGLNFVTKRAIKKGEELLVDYRTYDPNDEAVS